jgi:hypothetical protein
MDPRTAVFEAVEGIARLYERSMLTRSPLHLSACGGCGGPSFQQPCPLCSFYPMGSDKGQWHPHTATRGYFCEKVAASAPAGTGNLATWVLAEKKRTVAYRDDPAFRRRLDDALAVATGMDLPDPGSVFDLVVRAKVAVGRERVQRDLWSFWEIVDAIRLRPGLEDRSETAAVAVDDMHAGDFDGACAKLRALVAEEVNRDPSSRPDLRGALEKLDRISPEIESAGPAGPRP